MVCITFIPQPLLFSQNEKEESVEKEYREVTDDPYMLMSRSVYRTSPAYEYHSAMVSTYQVNVNDEGLNMLGDAANEPSIAINPLNPQNMLIGWRQFDTIASNFRQAGYAFTNDGGVTWIFPGVIEPGVFASDPVLDSDPDGVIYYNSLKAGFHCDVFKWLDGDHWDSGHYAFGGDKAWMVIDKTNGNSSGNIYAMWQEGVSSCDGSFTYSINHGESFDTCDNLPRNLTIGTIAIGPVGEIYACGRATWIGITRATNANQAGEDIIWDFDKLVYLGGTIPGFAGPNPEGLLGQVWVATDISNGPTAGNVYILATIANKDPADIMFSRSTDGAMTWSDAVKINDDHNLTYWNWFGTMSVAPNGRIDVAWLDTRGDSGHISALYFSYSLDGGLTWSPNQQISESFDPHAGYPNQQKIGDYYHMLSDDDGANLAWAATFNGEQDVYFSRILINESTSVNNPLYQANEFFYSFQNSPNPFNGVTNFKFNLGKAGQIKIDILDLSGHLINVLIAAYETPGHYSISWNAADQKGIGISDGIYIYRIYLDDIVMLTGKVLYTK
jgi:hypothetical protein